MKRTKQHNNKLKQNENQQQTWIKGKCTTITRTIKT